MTQKPADIASSPQDPLAAAPLWWFSGLPTADPLDEGTIVFTCPNCGTEETDGRARRWALHAPAPGGVWAAGSVLLFAPARWSLLDTYLGFTLASAAATAPRGFARSGFPDAVGVIVPDEKLLDATPPRGGRASPECLNESCPRWTGPGIPRVVHRPSSCHDAYSVVHSSLLLLLSTRLRDAVTPLLLSPHLTRAEWEPVYFSDAVPPKEPWYEPISWENL